MSYVISFLGSDHKCGSSQLALCSAEKISELCPQLKVLLFHAEEALGDDYVPYIMESMERIRPYLNENLVDYDDIYKRCHLRNNLFVIGGANQPASSGLFHPESIGNFLEDLGEYFDIILCDCGAEIEHGLTLGSLFKSKRIYLVFSQNESSLKKFEWMHFLYQKLELELNFVINKYSKDSPYDDKYICSRLEIKSTVIIPKSRSGEKAEMQGRSLLNYKDGGFSKAVEKLAREIISDYGKIQS